jgi:hypothetical protein
MQPEHLRLRNCREVSLQLKIVTRKLRPPQRMVGLSWLLDKRKTSVGVEEMRTAWHADSLGPPVASGVT